MPPHKAELALHDVGHRWRDGPMLFTGVQASLHPGDVVALTGPSGSGKSTLLSIIAGWLPSAAGTVVRQNIRRTYWVFQNPYGLPRRTTRDHVTFPLLARGVRRKDADAQADSLLNKFGLDGRADRPFSELSGGEAQRLMLARAVASAPDLLLVDEPTAQLDRASARMVNSVLAGLADAGAIVLVATHDEETVKACPTEISIGSAR